MKVKAKKKLNNSMEGGKIQNAIGALVNPPAMYCVPCAMCRVPFAVCRVCVLPKKSSLQIFFPVLLSSSVKRFGVSRMQDLYLLIYISYFFFPLSISTILLITYENL